MWRVTAGGAMRRSRQIRAWSGPDTFIEEWQPKRGPLQSRTQREPDSLNQFLRWVSMPEPEDTPAWSRLARDMSVFYRSTLPNQPPEPGDKEQGRWARTVFCQLRQLWTQLKQERFFSVTSAWSAHWWRVEGDRLVPSYTGQDPTSAILLAF